MSFKIIDPEFSATPLSGPASLLVQFTDSTTTFSLLVQTGNATDRIVQVGTSDDLIIQKGV
jgi:PKD repeat protein